MKAARKMRRMTAAPRMSESIRMAMKRLPMPASGNSIDTSSGVSMLSWSAIGSMATILSNQWLQKRRPYWERLGWLLNQAAGGGVRRFRGRNFAKLPSLSPGGQRSVDPAPGPDRERLRRTRQPVIGSRPPYHLFEPRKGFRKDLRFFARRLSGPGAAAYSVTYCCRW